VLVLIVGGSGQLGQALQRAAWPRGWTTIAPSRHALNITDPLTCAAAIDRLAPSIIINVAAMTAVDAAETQAGLAFAVNAAGARDVARAATARGVPLIHVSTDYVFDGTKAGAYVESDACNPLNVYGRSKRAGEQAVLETSAAHLVLRTSWLFGTEGVNFVKTMLRLAAKRDDLGIVGDQIGRPTAASDLALAIVRLAERMLRGAQVQRPSGMLHFAGEGAVSWYGFADAILATARAEGARFSVSLRPISTAEYPTPARRPRNSVLDCTRAASFGIAPPSWQPALREVIASCLRNEPMASRRPEADSARTAQKRL
jgi:dTDP-4-dehydrorhamnose reductase